MIIGSLRLAFFFYVVLTIIYFMTSVYSRSVRREKLEKEWDTDPAREGAPQDERRAFIEAGMQAYDKGLKRRLLWLIYVIPTIGFVAVIYFINWY
jgi:uncharacterized membrane protein